MSLRGRSAAVAILKPKVWHPVTKHGSTKQKETPITKDMDSLRCLASSLFLPRLYFIPPYHSSFRNGKSFRLRLPRRAQKLRPPRNDKSDRFCGKSEQFPERNDRKRNNFRNETFEKRCRAAPRKKRPQKMKNVRLQIKTPQFGVIAEPPATDSNIVNTKTVGFMKKPTVFYPVSSIS